MILTCDWKDQGWGNRKGKMFLVAQDKPNGDNITPNHLASMPFMGGRIIWESPTKAEHRTTSLTVSFSPQPNEVYQLWHRIGGGGGHSIHIRNIKLHKLKFRSMVAMDEDYRFFHSDDHVPVDDDSVLSDDAMSWHNESDEYNFGRERNGVREEFTEFRQEWRLDEDDY